MPRTAPEVSRGTVDPEAQRRILSHLHEAGARGQTKAKLAELEGCHVKKIDRAFKAFEEAGAVIRRITQGGVRFVLEKGPAWDRHIPPEARLALDVALQLVECPGSELWAGPLQALRTLVDDSVGPKEQAKLDRLEARISAHGTVYEAQPLAREILATLIQALDEEPPKELRIDYRDMHGVVTSRTIAPFSLSHDAFSGAIYLLAWDLDKDGARLFRVNRVERAEPTGRRAIHTHRRELERIRTYKIAGWFEPGEPFDVTVRVRGGWAQHLREACPDLPDVAVEEVDEHTVHLRFRALELRGPKRILLQFGEDAEVLEPPALRRLMAEAARGMGRLYQAP